MTRRGFTLIELVVSLAIIAIVVLTVVQIVVRVYDDQQEVRAASEPNKIGPKILEVMTLDLQNVFTRPDIFKTEYQIEDYFKGEAGLGRINLHFLTSHNSYLRYQGRQSDITEVGYELRPSDQGSAFSTLVRREEFFLDKEPLKGGFWQKLYDKIVSLEMVFYDHPDEEYETDPEFVLSPGNEQDEWDASVEEQLPLAVRIRLELYVGDPARFDPSRPGQIHQYQTLVTLPKYRPIKKNDELFAETLTEDPSATATPTTGGAAGAGGTPATGGTGASGGALPTGGGGAGGGTVPYGGDVR